jgi:hypothetical protein
MANNRNVLNGEFRDNVVGAISPLNLRDLLDSVPLVSELAGFTTTTNEDGTRTTKTTGATASFTVGALTVHVVDGLITEITTA